MAFWDAIVLIVLIVVAGGAFSGRSRSRRRRESAEDKLQQADTDQRIAKLEDRVRVLERIVTDKRERLKDEIDAL